MQGYIRNYLELRRSFPFYGAYHSEWRNRMVHVIFVPAIYTTTLSFLARVQVTNSLSLSDVSSLIYALTFMKMEVGAGFMYSFVLFFMNYIAQHHLKSHYKLALGINVTGWIAQFISHAVFEKRAPAVFDDPLQAIHSSLFFVWLEVLFFFGYRPELKKELEDLVEARKAEIETKTK